MIKFIGILALLLFSLPSGAYIMYSNQPLNHALYAGHDQKLIVHGKIMKVYVQEMPETNIGFSPPDCTLHFQVSDVIMGSEHYKSHTFEIAITSFIWPENLVELKAGVNCFLLFDAPKDKKNPKSIVTVVPSVSKKFNPITTNEQARDLFIKEIIAALNITALKKSTDSKEISALLCQVAPILKPEFEKDILPYTKHENIWVKRAALAGLVYATQKVEYIKMVAKDAEAFFSIHKENDLIAGQEKDQSYAPYPYYFRYLFFLEKRSWTWGSRWDESEAEKHQSIMTVIRKTGLVSDAVLEILDPQK
jgi:hypothetical protein